MVCANSQGSDQIIQMQWHICVKHVSWFISGPFVPDTDPGEATVNCSTLFYPITLKGHLNVEFHKAD